MGMYPDFDPVNGGEDNWCIGKGIMSSSPIKPRDWSKCSRRNLWMYYNNYLARGPGWKWCMPGNFQKNLLLNTILQI